MTQTHDPFPSTERWLWTAAGAALLLAGLRTRPFVGTLLGLGGAWLIYRAQQGQRPLPLTPGADQAVDLDEQLHVQAPPAQVFAFWRDFSRLSALLPGVQAVEGGDTPLSRWTPTAGAPVDVEITELHAERLIAWRSRPGSAWTVSGRVTLRAAPAGGTDLRVQLRYPGAPRGGWGAFGSSARQQLLRRLRRLDEHLG